MKKNLFSRIGFIMAVAGSAIGLGNIWKFPYMTGMMGGGAFVLIYIVTVLLVGISLLIAEIAIGHIAKKNIFDAFGELADSHKTSSTSKPSSWQYAGLMAFSGLLILTFYIVVIGWIFYYIYLFCTMQAPSTLNSSEMLFVNFLKNNIAAQMIMHFAGVLVIAFIVYHGIKKGIERLNLIMMPALIIIFLGLLVYATTFSSFGKAFHFLFDFDFSKINSSTLLMAVGHSFFTLSIGMGAIITYSASTGKEIKILHDALMIVIADTLVALIAGLVIFTFLFAFVDNPAKGPGLVFISLPAIFMQMGLSGVIVGILFFIALSFAAITSAVSIIEPSIMVVIEKFGWSRKKAVIVLSCIVYCIGLLALLSNTEFFNKQLIFGSKNLFDWLDYLTSAILLPIGGIIIAIFTGFIVSKQKLYAVLQNTMPIILYKVWMISIRFIAPIGVLFVLLNESGLLK